MRKCNLCQSCWNLRCFAKLLGFCQATHEAPQNGVWFFDGHRGLLEDRFGFFHALSHRGWYHQQIHHSKSTINMTCESTHSRANSYIYITYTCTYVLHTHIYIYIHINIIIVTVTSCGFGMFSQLLTPKHLVELDVHLHLVLSSGASGSSATTL